MSMLDNSVIEITCPHCSKKTKQPIRSVKDDQNFVCSHCGVSSTVDAKGLRQGIKTLDNSVADLKRSLRKLGK